MPIQTIAWDHGKVRIVDQTRLPLKLSYLSISDHLELCEAIKKLRVRGAPAIGVAAAFGVVLGVQRLSPRLDYDDFIRHCEQIISDLAKTRPTAVNLFWALDRMRKVIVHHANGAVEQLRSALLNEALAICEEDRSICRAIGMNGASLIEDGTTILTHCNAGALATVDYGTALGVIYAAVEQGKKIRVFADETRPLLQGARLTCWELMQAKIDVTLICDSAAAFAMQQGKIDCIFVGADRIAANGDTANKIGTYHLAVLAKYHLIPFYTVAPISTIDIHIECGSQIPIEERSAEEVTCGFGIQTAPAGVRVYNPAFDVTPHQLITAIVTEQGIVRPPFGDNLKIIKNNT